MIVSLIKIISPIRFRIRKSSIKKAIHRSKCALRENIENGFDCIFESNISMCHVSIFGIQLLPILYHWFGQRFVLFAVPCLVILLGQKFEICSRHTKQFIQIDFILFFCKELFRVENSVNIFVHFFGWSVYRLLYCADMRILCLPHNWSILFYVYFCQWYQCSSELFEWRHS